MTSQAGNTTAATMIGTSVPAPAAPTPVDIQSLLDSLARVLPTNGTPLRTEIQPHPPLHEILAHPPAQSSGGISTLIPPASLVVPERPSAFLSPAVTLPPPDIPPLPLPPRPLPLPHPLYQPSLPMPGSPILSDLPTVPYGETHTRESGGRPASFTSMYDPFRPQPLAHTSRTSGDPPWFGPEPNRSNHHWRGAPPHHPPPRDHFSAPGQFDDGPRRRLSPPRFPVPRHWDRMDIRDIPRWDRARTNRPPFFPKSEHSARDRESSVRIKRKRSVSPPPGTHTSPVLYNFNGISDKPTPSVAQLPSEPRHDRSDRSGSNQAHNHNDISSISSTATVSSTTTNLATLQATYAQLCQQMTDVKNQLDQCTRSDTTPPLSSSVILWRDLVTRRIAQRKLPSLSLVIDPSCSSLYPTFTYFPRLIARSTPHDNPLL